VTFPIAGEIKLRWIYLSPHFDDAALSCGGLIWEQTRQGIAVAIWTVCAGDAPVAPLSPLALKIHQEWGISSAAKMLSLRRREDRKAARCLGADLVHFDIPDCIYRRAPTGELLYNEDVFGRVNPLDREVEEKITTALDSKLLSTDFLICPLCLGLHVDHILVRQAAERLHRRLLYYADIPYLFRYPDTLEPVTKGMKATLYPLSEEGLVAWQEGVAAYKTQIGMLFETEEKMRIALREEWKARKGIRLWNIE
jgi:LmbE family N-acetylglucosaminyl deacetylase